MQIRIMLISVLKFIKMYRENFSEIYTKNVSIGYHITSLSSACSHISQILLQANT